MAEESTQSIVIDAPPDRIMSVIADLEAYPEWAKAVQQTEVLETGDDGMPAQVRFTLDAGPVKDVYTLSYDWAPDGLSVTWELVKGQMQRAQHGQYLLRPLDGGQRTEVTYTLSVELVLPMIGLLRRKAEKMIMDTALKELKRRVEGEG
ncbi:SRPBCC family protein [Haloechinothrix sp. LS1_15]|uniref:SRPBCC family protein n=1 Tax=Haloechinothrix sp. LS1_15 TaxID=2652248 RepID=UPI002948376F|nr:SRPBCC family protein [Haloechinothrix sp. LS1_15]MDV6013451.1 SRPBCC family protein [Haloechinothrix sp. LS1_15]